MKIITFNDIMNMNITPAECYKWTEEMIVHKKETILPSKISMKNSIPGVFCNVMPSFITTNCDKKCGGGKNCYPLS